jgi:8-oxo-dGTP diphosphatase
MTTPETKERPQIGIGVMILKDGKVLLQKRKSKHGIGTYSFTGGHLEHLESMEDCARRETREEAGVEIGPMKFLCIYNIKKYAPKHYINILFIADWKSGEAKVMEPDKTETWAWYDLNNLPQPLFASVEAAVEAYKTGRNFYDF